MKRMISSLLICVLLCASAAVLASCGTPNNDAAKAEAYLKAAGYVVVSIPGGGKVGIDRSLTATKYDEESEQSDWIQLFYITDSVDGVYDYVYGLFMEEKEEEENKDKDIQFGKSEGVIWFGTPDAIKAAS